MKLALLLLVALPMVLCVDERDLLSSFVHLFDLTELKNIVNKLVEKVGSDASEALCEKECKLIVSHVVLHTSCPLVCQSLQRLAQHFHLH